jgi:hypothetical protein
MMENNDPLLVVNPKRPCVHCRGERHARKRCDFCRKTGMTPIDLCGLWSPAAGFLVCGGPSVNKLPYQALRERGIVSLAVNNVAGHIPVSAWCFGDPEKKFHHGIHLDPKCLTFAPLGKLGKHIRAKTPDGSFRNLDIKLRDCPGTFGFSRKAVFDAPTFFETEYAQWGRGGNQPADNSPFRCIDTMLLGVRLMHYLGCPTVYMLGVDFEMTEKEQYAFGQTCHARNGRYSKQNAMLRELLPTFQKVGFKVFNCNPESKCDVFPFATFEEALGACRGAVPKEPFDLARWYEKSFSDTEVAKHPDPVSLADLRLIQDGVRKP